jgi:hypothetical protein
MIAVHQRLGVLRTRPLEKELVAMGDLKPNLALNLAPFSRWTLRDKAAQRRLALR